MNKQINDSPNQKMQNSASFWKFLSIVLILILVGWFGYTLLDQSDTKDNLIDEVTTTTITPEVRIIEVSDEEIEQNIDNQIVRDARVFSDNVTITSTDGKITLTGTVPSYDSKKAAAENALDVFGVVSVDNELLVSFPDTANIPDDETLQSRIENLLAWNSDLESYDIEVSVNEGSVTLQGTVDSLWRKTEAEEQTYSAYGVHNVKNELAIVFTENYSDERIAEDIVSALERNSFIDEEDIDVRVTNGNVTLEGKVDTSYEFNTIEDIAFYTLGVVSVENEMTIVI